MSQNDTLKWLCGLSLILFTSSTALAQAAQPFKACVDNQLTQMGVNPAMQNRWNPNTIAGKLQIHAIRICEDLMNTSQYNPTEKSQSGQVVPAKMESTEDAGTAGIKDI
jgi:hypothetical protein